MVATGVFRVMASGSLLATWPLTKVKTPSTTDSDNEPSAVCGSKTISSRTIWPFSAIENEVSSISTTPTAPSAPEMIKSP